MATAGLVNPWAGHAWHDHVDEQEKPRASLIGGIFKEVNIKLMEDEVTDPCCRIRPLMTNYLKECTTSLLTEAGVLVQYHSFVASLSMDGRRIRAVKVISKGGEEMFEAKCFVDASGDADLAAMAGCEFTIGRPQDGLTQAMTVIFDGKRR